MTWYKRNRRLVWLSAGAGVPVAYLGIWLQIPWLMWLGIVVALPLLVLVLPFCLFILAANVTWPLWHPFLELVFKRNGAPFHEGDRVRILKGPHKGRVATVYEVWADRCEIRVDLGREAKESVTDVFGFLWVKKQESASSSRQQLGV